MSDTPEMILQAATRCIARAGARRMRVLDVAKEAGVSSGLLYYHFTDRDGLLAATLEYINTTALSYRNRTREVSPEPRQRVIDLLLHEFDDEDIRTNSIAWNELRASAVFDDTLGQHLGVTTGHWQHDIVSAIRSAQTSGTIDPGVDADDVAVTLTSLVEGLSGRWLTRQLSAEQAHASILHTAEALLPRPGAQHVTAQHTTGQT